MVKPALEKAVHPADWAGHINSSEWEIYDAVFDAVISEGIPFALGGAFALATYTEVFRNTKDLDLYILPQDRERMIELVTKVGLTDYFDEVPYDRRWIYRAHSGGIIVDSIWAMANQRALVDERWMAGPEVLLRGRTVKVAPPESVLWDKLYIMQRDRCDWPDIMNLLFTQGLRLNWESVLERLGNDIALLAAALSVFGWLSPGIALQFPRWLWHRLHMAPPDGRRRSKVDRRNAAFLDTRPWYAQEHPKPSQA